MKKEVGECTFNGVMADCKVLLSQNNKVKRRIASHDDVSLLEV